MIILLFLIVIYFYVSQSGLLFCVRPSEKCDNLNAIFIPIEEEKSWLHNL
ncbi:hypothetical protein NEISUBOT_05437 [Neisseria subflava NJ9703]|uniref:Uncharacterized protein n=1 Tax=Neisseria subflava NJ9703 TaxID=546268 RepID=A0A9W5IP60_NEISU|nr:hypothetical protein NEISUBOT_05437 [Neisseria subflava NJ9703]